ncbi:MAG: hypothetical protein Kow0098_13490 [Ignavibacteriaceae bacterium]
MPASEQFLVETDIIADHLTFEGSAEEKSALENLMQKGLCFTTVLNSTELFFSIRNSEDREKILAVLSALKVLGLHSRYSLHVHEFTGKVKTDRDALIAVTAKLNKLKIVTFDPRKYENSGLSVLIMKQKRG